MYINNSIRFSFILLCALIFSCSTKPATQKEKSQVQKDLDVMCDILNKHKDIKNKEKRSDKIGSDIMSKTESSEFKLFMLSIAASDESKRSQEIVKYAEDNDLSLDCKDLVLKAK